MAAASPPSHLSFFSWLLLLPLSSLSQTSSNITLGSSLTTLDKSSSWLSSSDEFAFGLYHLPNRNVFLLAIWFDKIPERTVVWSANGDKPVGSGSRIELTKSGQLVLFDDKGQEAWKPPIDAPVASAMMLNTGEFVLKGLNSSRIWGTFDLPTDTILPTQKLDQNSSLSSRRAEDDYSNGKFELHLQADGNLSLNTVNVQTGFRYESSLPIPDVHILYDSLGEYLGSGYQLVFHEKGSIGLLQRNGSISNLTWGESFPTREFYHRATIDIDGVFRHYVYPRTGRGSWRVVGAIPSNICMTVISYPGSGVCGFNSYCTLDENRGPRCECPIGYSYLKPNNTFEGCKPNFTAQSCNPDGFGNEKLQFEMKEMPNTTWIYSVFELYNPVDEGLCRSSCLDDCLCAVAVFHNGACLKMRLPLSNGRTGAGINGKALIKVLKSNLSNQDLLPHLCKGKKGQASLVLVGSVLLGGSGFLNFLFLSAISLAICYYHKKQLRIHDDSSLSQLNLRSFTFKELEEATHGFKEELGKGGFGTVFKGVLASDSCNVVAVKRLDRAVQESEREFKTEVSVIGQTHHRNLVHLLGFCDEGSHRLLVYEFMSNGSLARFLFGTPRLDWSQRCEIVMGIAKGLMYLQEECRTQIIHCDVKPQNILLDDYFVARIADFGIAKLLKTDHTRTTGIRGTPGYLAPEWFKNLWITVKVDVYSFGIVLLEIICCRRHVENMIEHEEEAILKDWAYKCYRDGRLDLLVGDDREAIRDRKVLERMVMVAIWCVQEDPSLRPSMKRVVRMIAGVAEVSVPGDPCFS